MSQTLRRFLQNERNLLLAILLLALVNGLFYVFTVPPWQHYDEPNHFEYVWLLNARGTRPQPGDYDTGMRQAVLSSMIEHGFFDGWRDPPVVNVEQPWIGRFHQLDEPPLYYLLASLPLGLLPDAKIDTQLYAARLVSLSLFLVTILAGWGAMAQITPPRHPLRFLTPLTMALLPAFVDLMTAVNNDVGAITAFSLFLWGSLRLIQRGPSWGTLLWVLVTTGLCLLTKRSAYIALPLFGMALIFALLRGRLRKIAWSVLFVAALLVFLVAFAWGDAAIWYRNTPQNTASRTSVPGTPVGQSVFHLSRQPGEAPVKLVQILPAEIATGLSGQTLTLGAWIWASQPLETNTPQFQAYDGRQTYGQKINLTTDPQFFALTFTPSGDTGRAWVTLNPQPAALNTPVEVYYDGVVLAEGVFPVDQAPQFANEHADGGQWDATPFENLLRNASAERSWLYLRPWADALGSKVFSDYEGQESFALTIYSLLDPPATAWYYRQVAERLFRTFWAKFGWAHVPLLGGKPYARLLLPVTLLAFAGLGLALWQRRKRLGQLAWAALGLLGLTLAVVWGMAWIRGATYLLTRAYIPVGRYTYPAIIPTVFLLSGGWYTLLQTLAGRLRLSIWVIYALYVGLLITFNVYALVSIAQFYAA